MNELIKQDQQASLSIYDKIADPIAAAETMGDWFTRSGLFGCDKSEQGKMLALVCLMERKSPTEITRNYDIVQGRLRKKAMALHADFRSRGGKIRWIETGDDGIAAKAEFTFEGDTVTVSYSIEQAKAAGLVKSKSAWESNPGNMLRARVVSNGVGMLCPEIIAGESDEVEHVPAPAPKINLTKEEPKPVNVTEMPKQAKPAKAAPAEIVVEAEPEPAPAPKEEPKPETSRSMGEMDQETFDAMVKAMSENGIDHAKAIAYAQSQGWITAEQDLTDFPLAKARRIISQAASFARAINNWKGGTK